MVGRTWRMRVGEVRMRVGENDRVKEASRWLDIPDTWILFESSSSYCSGWYCYYTEYYARRVFDNDPFTYWEPRHQPPGYQHWFILDLQTSFTIQRLAVTNTGDPVRDVVNVILKSSSVWPFAWEEVFSTDAVVPGTTNPQHFELNCVGRYLYLLVDTQTGTRPVLAEVSFYGIENTGDPEGLSCHTLNTGCVISDTAVQSAPPGGQSCYVIADIHEGLRTPDNPLSVHRTGNVTLHGDLQFECAEDYEWQIGGWRCGGGHISDYNIPAKCDPDGIHPCCSDGGWCGNSPLHCDCAACIDYRGQAIPKWQIGGWRCGGGHISDYNIPAKCDPDGIHPCCSDGGWCGNSPLHCDCAACIDYRGQEGIVIHSGVNLAERGKAYSSVYDAPPDRVIDGDTSTAWASGSCMHTPSTGSVDPWVQIDLCGSFTINSVVIYNRGDELPERANPFNLHMGDSADITQNPVVQANMNFDPSSLDVITIPVSGVTARYVGIVLPGPSRVLHICEFQVYVDDSYIPFDNCLYTLGCEVAGATPGELVYAAPFHARPPGLIANVSVEITAGENPPITLHTLFQIAPDSTLTGLDLLCAENCNPTDTLAFLPLELYTESDLYGTTEFSLLEFPADFAGQDWTSGIESSTSDRLRVLGGTFWVQGRYTIRITDVHVTASGDWSRTADYSFEVLPPPELLEPVSNLTRACTLLPAGGVSLIDRFCLSCPAFTDILGPVEVSISFELIPIGVEVATTTFPGDGPPTDNRILISLSSLWVGYTPLVDIAAGIILLNVRVASVDGRFLEFDLAPLEIGIPTMAQLQSYLDNYFAYPDGDFFRSIALGDTQAAFNVAIFASAIVGRLANEGEDTLEVFDKLMEALSHVEINDEVSINGVSLTILLASGVPEMVSGESQSQNATTTCFEGFDILDDIYLTKLMPEFEDPEIYADITMSKMHLRIKRENRTRYSERVYLVGGDSDSLVRTTSFSDLLGNSCWGSPEVGIQFLEANFNPFEYSNNSHQIRSDVTGLGVKCGTRTHDVSGLSEPIDILTRRKNESLDGSIYVFETTEPLGSLAIFQFFAGKEQSALGFNIDVNSTLFPQDISLFLRKDGLPTQDVFNWTATLPLPEDQLFSIPWIDQAPWSNETNLTSSAYQWLLPREEVDITDYDVGNMTAYFIGNDV
uniref:F5/8 type C domain-containing protein n=1 Tax=Branchiostoma floridae TaxID=7739 RepID=C3YMN0_BRAFL|eukprot:XP_002602359.1 hypothetical protein BRAFLDRAFT_98012 [Branchiostoma floridae]